MRLNNQQKLDILKSLQDIQYQELNFRRNREFHIFLWSATILTIINGCLSIDDSTIRLVTNLTIAGKILYSFITLLIPSFSIIWQNRERQLANSNCRVIAKINGLHKLFNDKTYFSMNSCCVLPKEWEKWGTQDLQHIKRYLRGNFITALCLLWIITITLLWIR